MKVRDLATLYVESLRDLYSAETQLIEALPKVAQAASSKDLKQAVQSHLKETKEQSKRLEKIIKELNEEPGGHKCKAMEGLIKETDELIRDVQEPAVLDAALIGGAQKVEHYEISGYGTARTFALLLGYHEHADLLQQTQDEEYAADDALGDLAEGLINQAALNADKDKPVTNGSASR
jgi:ferritin-like metal-binding protein YciE